jgi:hypothetical protein
MRMLTVISKKNRMFSLDMSKQRLQTKIIKKIFRKLMFGITSTLS